jgi:CDP-diglyceride synthetase
MTSELLLRLTLLFAGLFILGNLLCLPLFHWNLQRFFTSTLWIKIFWWIPIYGIFLLLCYGKIWIAVPLVLLILILAFREYTRQRLTPSPTPLIVKLYVAFFAIATLHIAAATLAFDPTTTISILITICFCSVLSDVCAFFLGSYASWHKLPSWINQRKSWEGVAGQLIGAFIGAGLVILTTGNTISWWLVLAIGIASAFGDLFNSAAKRQLDIKDWGQTIPGHGGVLDRMSSLSTTFMVVSLLALII